MSANLFSSSVDKAWSDNARQKSAEARRDRKTGNIVAGTAAVATGAAIGARAYGQRLASQEGKRSAAHKELTLNAMRNRATANEFAGIKGGEKDAERWHRVADASEYRAAKVSVPSRLYGIARALRIAKFSDTEQRDAQGRWSGLGEHIGGVAGSTVGVYHARRVASTINRTLKKPRTVNVPARNFSFSSKRVMHGRVGISTPARSFTLPKMKRGGRWGAAAVGAYAAVRGAGALGGYIGSKIDDATSRVFNR